jgi:DNA-directed RNA polymerase specialized sigma24 family protein
MSADTGDTLALPLQREAMSAALDLVDWQRELPASLSPRALRHDREVPLHRSPLADRAPASLSRALDTLPDTSRGVVRMYLAGYAQHEIADLLGWTNGELRATLHRGFAELRDAMSRMGCAPEAWE